MLDFILYFDNCFIVKAGATAIATATPTTFVLSWAWASKPMSGPQKEHYWSKSLNLAPIRTTSRI